MAGRIENLTHFQPGVSGNPGGRPKSRLYSQAARELLEAAGDVPTKWDVAALTNAQKAVLADFKAWITTQDSAARQQMLDRAEGKPALADEDRDALGERGSGTDALLAVLGLVRRG